MRHSSTSERGFALVIALSLMAFVVLLLLSISTLVRVESQSAAITQDRLKARLNAQLGAMVALGQLQKYAGPDQRVTARADIALAANQNVSDLENPLLTGVWLAESGSEAAVPFFLISGNEGFALNWRSGSPEETYPEDMILPNAVPDDTWAELATGSITERSSEHDVSLSAPRVTLTSSQGATAGTFAYAVLDEGIKANVAIGDRDPLDTTDSFKAEDVGFAAQRFGVGVLPTFNSLPTSEAALSRLSRVEDLRLLAPAVDVEPYSFDLTGRSKGLLTNTRDGGLKRNLTAALYDDSEFNDLLADFPDGKIFPSQFDGTLANDPGGPNWQLLRDHYQYFTSDAVVDNDRLTVRSQTDSQSGVFPVIKDFQYFYHASLIDGSSPDLKRVRFHHYPAVSLWNPYDREIEAQTYYLFFNPYRFWGGSWVIAQFHDSDQQNPDKNSLGRNELNTAWDHESQKRIEGGWGTGKFANDRSLNQRGAMMFRINAPAIQPGEALAFSPSGVSPYSKDIDSIEAGQNDLVLGPPSHGNFFYGDSVKDDPNLPDDEIDVSINPNPYCQLLTFNSKPTPGHYNNADLILATTTEAILDDPLVHIRWGIYGTGFNFGLMKEREFRIQDFTSPDATASGSTPAMGIAMWNAMAESPRMGLLSSDNNYAIPVRWLANANPRAAQFGPTGFESKGNIAKAYKNSPQIKAGYVGDPFEVPGALEELQTYDLGKSPVGFEPDNLRAVLFDTKSPRHWHSIGEFMHVPLYSNPIQEMDSEETGDNGVTNAVYPAYLVGNSLASPWIALDETARDDWGGGAGDGVFANSDRVLYDQSYLLNEALWDRFFLTSHYPGPFDGDNDPVPFPLPNPRLLPVGTSAPTNSEMTDYEETAEKLNIVGSFNINSTSEAAWAALLGSFLETDFSATYDNAPSSPPEGSPFIRYAGDDMGISDSDDKMDSSEIYFGARTLRQTVDDPEIQTLAREIVAEVRERGPFRTLAEFINRDPDSGDVERQLKGPLQAAIERMNLNAHVDEGTLVPDFNSQLSSFNSYLDDYIVEALEGLRNDNTPGAFTPMDLLARAGSLLTPRSDTFSIIVEGESLSAVTSERAVARCEMVVQRTVEKVDAPAGEEVHLPSSGDFGRRFKIVSFRWIEDS